MFKSWWDALRAWLAPLAGLPMALFEHLPKIIMRLCRWIMRRIDACLRHLWLCLRKRCMGKGAPVREPPSRATSIPISHPSYKRPDPLIYDQYYLMSLGLAVTWQNPDIEIFLGGSPVTSAYDLAPSTTYEVKARIWNGSPDAVVSGLPVTFSYLSFGVQTQSHPIGDTVVDLGVKGSAHCPAVAKIMWTTPAAPGHYCIQVSFSWLDDSNPLNNLGQENTQVVQAASPAPFVFSLGNPGRERQAFRFEFDTYALPTPELCEPDRGRGAKAPPVRRGTVPPAVAGRHARRDFPLPADWTISFAPEVPILAPGDEQPITVTVTPPDNFHGALPVNVHVFAGTRLVGGVTALVNRA